MNAFLTGSRAYGRPRVDSDIDLVVLLDPSQALKLASDLGQLDQPSLDGKRSNVSGGHSLRCGQVNLIIPPNAQEFEAWHRATLGLQAEKPVTRQRAIEVIECELKSVREAVVT